MSQTPSELRTPRLRVARGPRRPDYLGNRDLDRFMMMFTTLIGEVSALRDRIDTHELLAAAGQVATPDAIESFIPEPGDTIRRSDAREAMLRRIFRVALEELEQIESDGTLPDQPVEEDAAR